MRLLFCGLALLLASACATTAGAGTGVPARAEQYLLQARDLEPFVTALLREIAERREGDLVGLEHRFKTRKSLERKIAAALVKDPGLRARDVVIDDALRYTVRVGDTPAGHHVRVIREILSAFTSRGHHVVKVKNYWPGGDTYSGVNSILEAPGGLWWELQFHTPLSLATKSRTHPLYDVYRLSTTDPALRRELFAEMAALWFSIPIPAGILRPGALHPRDEVILRLR